MGLSCGLSALFKKTPKEPIRERIREMEKERKQHTSDTSNIIKKEPKQHTSDTSNSSGTSTTLSSEVFAASWDSELPNRVVPISKAKRVLNVVAGEGMPPHWTKEQRKQNQNQGMANMKTEAWLELQRREELLALQLPPAAERSTRRVKKLQWKDQEGRQNSVGTFQPGSPPPSAKAQASGESFKQTSGSPSPSKTPTTPRRSRAGRDERDSSQEYWSASERLK